MPNNVDYDVSYVNYAYLPAAMEPYGNPLIGYVGLPSRIEDVNAAISNWLATGGLAIGWPLYKGSDGNAVPGKIPSALEIFLNAAAFNNTNVFTPAPAQSVPIMAMTTQIADCLTSSCALFRDVAALLIANYQNYRNVGLTDKQTWTVVWQCTGTPPSAPDPDLASLLAHFYGWAPFNENCANTMANQLYDTPGYNDPNNTPNY